MTSNTETKKENPLGVVPVGKLMPKFAIPCILAFIVGSLYNIVDQFFIGQKIGELGNAATNIAFPLSNLCTATGLLFGIGGASRFNLNMGAGQKNKAPYFIGNAATMLVSVGILWTIITQIFLKQLLVLFGSPNDVLGYAMQYTSITSFGFPLVICQIGCGHLIRADGRPTLSMLCNVFGAIVNTFLDWLFVFGFDMGMSGAAIATVIGQASSLLLAIYGLLTYRTVKLKLTHFIPRIKYIVQIMSLGAANCFNQIAMMIVQITMNKTLKYYGGLSNYGEAIPIACSGIIAKVNMLFMSFVIGLSQSIQPIVSFNYGAKKYGRVKEAYKKAIFCGGIIAVLAFISFQIFPRQIISIFGNGSELYIQFAVNYFHIFMFFTFANFMQPITSNFFTSIGKPKGGAFLSLTRQIIFFLPTVLILPLFMGIDGVMFAGPVADGSAAIVATIMARFEFKKISRLEKKTNE